MGAILGLVGGQAGGAGAILQAKGATESARYNRKLGQFKAELADEDSRKAGARTARSNVVAAAKSGVRLEGSPLEVLANNAYNEERTRSLAMAGVQIQSDLLTRGGQAAMIQGGLSAGATILGSSGQAGQSISAGQGVGPSSDARGSQTFGTPTAHQASGRVSFP